MRSDIPTVTIDFAADNLNCVMSDNVDGTYSLVNYLAGKGHRKIAFIHGEHTSVTEKRLIGFYRGCEQNGIEVPEEYVIKAVYHDPKSSARATEYLMQLDDPPTAIMYPDDFSYIGGMNQLERMGLSIPDDVSVTGYDGITLSEVLRPKLTTYYQDAEAIGRESARRLVDVIENPKTSIPEKIMVTGRLIEGKSVKQI